MPRIYRVRKRRRPDALSQRVTHALTTGHDFAFLDSSHGPELSDDLLREAWGQVGGDLTDEFRRQHPGHRPAGWWRFEAVERRRRIDGKPHPFDNPARREHLERIARRPGTPAAYLDECHELSFGAPRCLCVLDDFEAVYEPEAEYLERLDLLTSQERRALSRAG